MNDKATKKTAPNGIASMPGGNLSKFPNSPEGTARYPGRLLRYREVEDVVKGVTT